MPVDAQRASEVEEIGTGSENSAQQRLEELSPLYNLTVFCKKPDRIKGCFEKISFLFDFSEMGSERKDDKVQPPAPQFR